MSAPRRARAVAGPRCLGNKHSTHGHTQVCCYCRKIANVFVPQDHCKHFCTKGPLQTCLYSRTTDKLETGLNYRTAAQTCLPLLQDRYKAVCCHLQELKHVTHHLHAVFKPAPPGLAVSSRVLPRVLSLASSPPPRGPPRSLRQL